MTRLTIYILISYILIFTIAIGLGKVFSDKDKLPTQIQKVYTDSVVKAPVVDNTRYYYAIDFGLPSGKVVDFSPNDETIMQFQCAGGEKPDEQIYIHILDNNGVIRVYESNYKTWLVVYEGAVLK